MQVHCSTDYLESELTKCAFEEGDLYVRLIDTDKLDPDFKMKLVKGKSSEMDTYLFRIGDEPELVAQLNQDKVKTYNTQ